MKNNVDCRSIVIAVIVLVVSAITVVYSLTDQTDSSPSKAILRQEEKTAEAQKTPTQSAANVGRQHQNTTLFAAERWPMDKQDYRGNKQEDLYLILNEREDPDLRQLTLEEYNWNGQVKELNQLIETTSSIDVRAAAISAATNLSMSAQEREETDQTVIELFWSGGDDVPQAVILDYFSDRDPIKLDVLLASGNLRSLPLELQEHVDRLR